MIYLGEFDSFDEADEASEKLSVQGCGHTWIHTRETLEGLLENIKQALKEG